jgi:hypothetical protein
MAEMMSRYEMCDEYTLEELKRKYQRFNPEKRIQLLQEIYSHDCQPPYEIALLAVQDQNVEVREWMARHGKYLDYREWRRVNEHWERDPDPPERDLAQIIHG